jgi:hypothetical protein
VKTYFDICHVFPLNGRNATPFIELDLPDPAQICQEVLDKLPSLDIPHFECTIRAGNDLLTVMLEACDSSGVRTKLALAGAGFGIPDAKGRVSSGRDEPFMTQVQEADERRVALQVEKTLSRLQRPDLDERVHGPAYAAIASMIQDDTIYLLGMALKSM